MTEREALKLALEALELTARDYREQRHAIAAIREALAQPEQEPVAWGMMNDDGKIYDCICPEEHDRFEGEYTVPLYTTPPQRKPLTDVTIWNTYKNLWMFHPAEEPRLAGDVLKFARAIEAAHGIKEKNT